MIKELYASRLMELTSLLPIKTRQKDALYFMFSTTHNLLYPVQFGFQRFADKHFQTFPLVLQDDLPVVWTGL